MSERIPPIRVIVAETSPLISESLARALGEDPHLIAVAATAPVEVVLEQCRRQTSVLLAAESFLQGINSERFAEQVDCGRGISILVLGSDSGPGAAVGWLHVGCMGYLSRDQGVETLCRAIRVVAEGQIWARRKDLTIVVRELLTLEEAEPRFTLREREILERVAAGATNEQISGELFISADTVRWHLQRLFGKVGARNRTEAALWARQNGFGQRLRDRLMPPPRPVQRVRWELGPRTIGITHRL